MKYKGVEMDVVFDSLSIVPNTVKDVRHFPYTSRSVEIAKGRRPTRIECQIVAIGADAKREVEEALNSTGVGTLELVDRKYYNVSVGDEVSGEPAAHSDQDMYLFAPTFLALDPIPRDLETGDKLWD